MKGEEDFYQEYRTPPVNEENKESNNFFKDEKNKKKLFIYGGLIILLLAVLTFLVILIINKNKDEDIKADITLNQQSLSIVKGNRSVINITRNTDDIIITWTSTNESVATVDEGGNVTALLPGNASIILKYTGSDLQSHELECKIVVVAEGTPIIDNPSNDNPSTDKPSTNTPTYEVGLAYTFSQGKENTWTKTDAIISLTPTSSSNVSNIKYAINCTSNCSYSNVTNNKMTISKEGNNKVTVIVTYNDKRTVQKDITVKIDKTAPTCTINSQNVNEEGVIVSITGKDSLSGIKTINGSAYSGNSATYSTTLKTAKVNELVVVDNALNETKCSKITTVMCNKYDYSKSCTRCQGAGVILNNGENCTNYTTTNLTLLSPIYTLSKAYSLGYGGYYYHNCTVVSGKYLCQKCKLKTTNKSSCSICGADTDKISTIYSSDGNLSSTTTEYYKIQSGTKVCLNSCDTGCGTGAVSN